MKKALGIILAFALLFSSIGYTFAIDETEAMPVEAQKSVQILEEDVSKRTEYEKHFLQSDGSYIAVSYADPVHKQLEDGSFEKIDNTLSLKNGRFENTDENFKVSFAEKSEKNLVNISYDEYTMSWGLSSFTYKNVLQSDDKNILPAPSDKIVEEESKPADNTEIAEFSDESINIDTDKELTTELADDATDAAVITDETSTALAEDATDAAVTTDKTSKALAEDATDTYPVTEEKNPSEPVADDKLSETRVFESAQALKPAVVFDKDRELAQLSEEQRKTATPKINSELLYTDILGDGISAQYSVNPDRVKEDIILNAPSDFSGYAMDITAKGLTAVKEENNSVEFLNDKKEVAFILQTPYMYDAADDISYDIDIEIEETTEGCRIIFTPNAEWLNAEERAYPIVIDPTVTSSRTLSNAHDAYVYEGSENTGATVDRMYVGIKRAGFLSLFKKIHRAYWRAMSLPSLGSNYTITNASFIVQHPSGTTSSRPFSLYGVNGSWTESGITWDNRPTSETLLVSGVDRNGLIVTFGGANVTQRVRDWYSGAKPNYGFMIRYTDESKTNPDYNSFWTCDGSTASYVPYFSVTYTASTETWTLQGRLKNVTEGPDYIAQGFAVGTDYCYCVNVDEDDVNHKLYRKNMNNSSDAEFMTAINPTGSMYPMDSLGHSNDMTLATYTDSGGTIHRYLYVVANGGPIEDSYIVKLEYSGTTYWQVARYDFTAVYTSISRVKYYINADNEPMVQFLLRSGNYGYYTASVRRAQTGVHSLSTTHRFDVTRPLDYTYYANQGLHYENDTIYVPLFGFTSDEDTNPNKPKDNVILVYDGIDDAIASTPTDPISSSKAVTIEAVNTGISLFEIESIGFPVNNSNLNNDLLWFNTNEKIGTESVNGGVYCDSQDIK